MVKNDPRNSMEEEDRFAEHIINLYRMEAGSQRLYPPGPRFYRPRDQQKIGDRSRLPCTRFQLPVIDHGSLPAQPALCKRDHCRQTSLAPMAEYGGSS